MSKVDRLKEWMSNNDIGGDQPIWDSENTYYNLNTNQIIAVSHYLSQKDKKSIAEFNASLDSGEEDTTVSHLIHGNVKDLVLILTELAKNDENIERLLMTVAMIITDVRESESDCLEDN